LARTLEATWERRLREVERAEADLAAQRARRTSPLSAEELALLSCAGADLRAIFDAPSTSQRDRKLLLRALIIEICVTVDRDAGTIDVTIAWEGSAKTQLAPLTLRRQGQPYRNVTPEDTVALVRRLAAHYDDEAIALVLANQQRRTATGLRFTKRRVAQLRDAHGISAFTPDPAADADGELVSVRHAARELGVDPATVYRWLRDGFIAGEQPAAGAPWRIHLDAALRAKVAEDAPDGWLALDDAARALGVVRQTVLHRVQRGELAASARAPRQAQRPTNPGQTRTRWTVCHTAMTGDAMSTPDVRMAERPERRARHAALVDRLGVGLVALEVRRRLAVVGEHARTGQALDLAGEGLGHECPRRSGACGERARCGRPPCVSSTGVSASSSTEKMIRSYT